MIDSKRRTARRKTTIQKKSALCYHSKVNFTILFMCKHMAQKITVLIH
jgi:hypothetical protein